MNFDDLKLVGIRLDPAVEVRARKCAADLGITMIEFYNRVLRRAVIMPELHGPIEGECYGGQRVRKNSKRRDPLAVPPPQTEAAARTVIHKATAKELHQRGFSKGAIASILKVTYAEVERQLKGATP